MKRRIGTLPLALALLVGLFPAAVAKEPTLIVALKLNSPWCVVGMGGGQSV